MDVLDEDYISFIHQIIIYSLKKLSICIKVKEAVATGM